MHHAQIALSENKMYQGQARIENQMTIDLPCLLCLHSALNCRAARKQRQNWKEKEKLKKLEKERLSDEVTQQSEN